MFFVVKLKFCFNIMIFCNGTDKRTLLGSMKVSTDNKITIVKKAVDLLKIEKGDHVAFYGGNDRIYIEKG